MTELDGRRYLVPYLFTYRDRGLGQWYGVSAYSLADALALLHAYGYEVDPADPTLEVRENVKLTPFEERHLGPNMGPMQLRGVWYPRHNLGDEARNAGRVRDQVT